MNTLHELQALLERLPADDPIFLVLKQVLAPKAEDPAAPLALPDPKDLAFLRNP